MPHRRHTITVATSALFFVCLMLHAQANPNSQAFLTYNNAQAYKVYEALLPTDWSITVAHARRLLIQSQVGSPDLYLKPVPQPAALLQPVFHSLIALSKISRFVEPDLSLSNPYEPVRAGRKSLAEHYSYSAGSYIVLSPVAFHADNTPAVVSMGHSCGSQCDEDTFYVLENKSSIWKNMRWRGTSCAWAS
jgi:hypothetical protein